MSVVTETGSGPVDETQARRSLLPSLAGMRFLAATTVFLAHAALQIPFTAQRTGGWFLFISTAVGFSAVSYFFMLSGFVLTWTRRPGDTTSKFFRRRFSRVLPSHLIALTAAVVLGLVAGDAVGLRQVVAQAFLVQAWIPSIGFIDVLNSLTWSMSVEVSFYLMFPLLLPLLTRIRVGRLWAWVGGLLALDIVWPFVVDLLVPDSGTPHPLSGMSLLPFLHALDHPDQPMQVWGEASYTQVWFVYHFPLARLSDFVLGVLLARIVMNRRWIGLRPGAALLLMVPAWTGALFVPFLYRLNCVTIVPMFLLLGSLAAADHGGRRSRLGSARMVHLGNLTYGFYLVHGLVLIYGHRALGTEPSEDGPIQKSFGLPAGVALLAGAYLVSLALAWVLFRWVETPSTRRWGAERITDPPPEPEPAAAVEETR